jgi:hypothetical protein
MWGRLVDAVHSYTTSTFRSLVSRSLVSALIALLYSATTASLSVIFYRQSELWWSGLAAGVCVLALCDAIFKVFFRRRPPRPGSTLSIEGHQSGSTGASSG